MAQRALNMVATNVEVSIGMDTKEHWEEIYRRNKATQVDWFKPHLESSFRLLSKFNLNKRTPIIDIGGGTSTFIDDLLNEGFKDITIVDITKTALEISQKRVGERDAQIRWVEDDITKKYLTPEHYGLWHDRATFHFLTQLSDRKKYIRLLRNCLQPEGYAIIATFSLEGPSECSGLEVIRYNPASLQKELGKEFQLTSSQDEVHTTPTGIIQKFVYCLFQKI